MANTRTVGAAGDHTTLASAVTWVQANHDFDTDGIATIEEIDGAEYTEILTLSGFTGTMSSSAYLILTAAAGKRTAGVESTSVFRLKNDGGGNDSIRVDTDWVEIKYVEFITDSTSSSHENIRVQARSNILIHHCLFHADSNVAQQDGIYCSAAGTTTIRISNCVFYGYNRAGIMNQNNTATITLDIDYCSGYKFGGNAALGESFINNKESTGGTSVLNVYNTVGGSAVDQVYETEGTGTPVYTGSNNIADDTSAEGRFTSSYDSVTFTTTSPSSGENVWATNLTEFSEDLTIGGDNAFCVSVNGTDRVGSEPDSRQDFSVDIAGVSRDGTTPTIGAFEFADSGITGTLNSTLGAISLTASGELGLLGTLNQTLETINISASGQVSISGTLDRVLADLALAASGQVDVSGSLAVVLDTLGITASGTVGAASITGILDSTLESVVVVGTGAVSLTGTLVVTLDSLSIVANGTVLGSITGTLDETLGDLVLVASGLVTTPGGGGSALILSTPLSISNGTESTLPVSLSVSNNGGVSGLTVNMSIRDGGTLGSYLDFADLTFKTSGWGSKVSLLNDQTGGMYALALNVAGIVNLPGNNLIVEYSIAGSITAVAMSSILLSNVGIWNAGDALNVGTFLALKDA